MPQFLELNGDQSREMINTRQRYQAWRNADARDRGYRGSMVWQTTKGHEYLFRVYYDEEGKRRQKALGNRSPETEAVKDAYDRDRAHARDSRQKLDALMDQQAAVNRALGLGRVPLVAARILRLLDQKGLLGQGLRVVGTNALFAYEASSGVMLDSAIMTTGDLDLLVDARTGISFVGTDAMEPDGLIGLLKKTDKSFRKAGQSFRAENDDGYMVDLITPMRNPPWAINAPPAAEPDLSAAEIEGLTWLENAPSFDQICIDERGQPLLMKTIDPRVFALHKSWVSEQPTRDPLKRRRDAAQAQTVFDLTSTYLSHLQFKSDSLRMLPKAIYERALSALSQ
jgi:hypothetical protein